MIRLVDVTKRFDAHSAPAVDNLSIEVNEGEIAVLVGPSGCGKTTTLRMINRLTEPTSGRIEIAGEDVTHANPVTLRRRIGYVIQQVGLFPHYSVAENIATVPKLLHWDASRVSSRVAELLDLVGLDETFAKRYPHELSGGQRQRIGVARALAADPPVLLMDEPFGAIDPITRDRLQQVFLQMQREIRKTVVFVTHDLSEAVLMGDRIALLDVGGRLAQFDTPAEILGHPADGFVAEFVGSTRGLRRLEVMPVQAAHLDTPPVVGAQATVAEAQSRINGAQPPVAIVLDDDGRLQGFVRSADAHRTPATLLGAPEPATIGVTSLKDALATILLGTEGWIPVSNSDGRYVGVLTPDAIHRATRADLRA